MFPTVLNMFVDILHWCPIVQNIVMDVLVDWVLKGLPSQHYPWLLRCMCCADRGYFFSHQAVAGATHVSMRSYEQC